MNHLILTGMPASGKTTVGKIAAVEIGLPFIDADHVFEKEMGLPPGTYIRRFGEERFRFHESRLLRSLVNENPAVIATGGGVVLKPMNRSLLQQSGFVVWVDVPAPMLLLRLQENFDRPLIEEPPTYSEVERILEERKPFYQKCHYRVENAYVPPKRVALEVVQHYNKWNASGAAQ